jgi:sigma-B regulation protein RsbU (phosphoserine phosphatase)
MGLAACCIAAIRRRRGIRAILWLGVWSVMYGSGPLAHSLASVEPMPHWFLAALPWRDVIQTYFLAVAAALAFLELTSNKLRSFLYAVVAAYLAIGIAGILFFVFTGATHKVIAWNQLVATVSLAVLVTVLAFPALSRKYLVLPNRGVLAFGTIFFAVEALFTNLARPLGYRPPQFLDDIGFAVLILSLGYAAMQIVDANEHRLLAIESELAIAREIQTSSLPVSSPVLSSLRIAAAYQPMTAVAGDFYDFIPVDENRAGFLVADVSGHGVPAALIAAMLKVALKSVVSCADDPAEVLRGLNRIISGQLHSQFVSASYLWLNSAEGKALYSAAGHPPLLRWRAGKLDSIESNGLIFGVIPEPDFPVFSMNIEPGDRFLLYTDGVVEPENDRGEAFGDSMLEQIVRNNESQPPSQLVEALLSGIRRWQPAAMQQQDDITLIVIDAA